MNDISQIIYSLLLIDCTNKGRSTTIVGKLKDYDHNNHTSLEAEASTSTRLN